MSTRKPEPAAQDPAIRVLRRFRLVFNAIKTHFRQVEKHAGLGGAQVWALSVIAQSPGIGVGELALAMDIHQSTASNLVRSLIEHGLVVTAKGGKDRRAVQLSVLPAGTKILKKAPMPFAGVLPGALRSLDAATLERLEQDLDKLIEVLHPDKRGAKIPLAD
ncbi:MarR family winged helix-turn-helix transcriptional regulator [Ramlibacter albus]|uniref:Winged helix-turn-helix transcriptional regulator n=1 Tax=Ramlibacter albus TaxID=2079448 RepID=A0A923S6W0_9BURK|nr:MarR family winged helix-turn-helix transcriptional regulator [Ramlibacter albus]MBC5766552.1 winged helix-turn-helix transcriptional regulator [Ramlibacter albus]